MKSGAKMLALAALLVAPGAAVQLRSLGAGTAPGTISQVVSLLQGMLDKSKQEGTDDRTLYGKFKCYCDDNEEAKTQSIEDLTKEIGLLENQVSELQASNGQLSTECARLKADMAKNEQARNAADALRTKENEAFVAEEADLQAAIGQLGQAVEILSAIGADQSLASSAAHEEFMGGYGKNQASLVKLRNSVKQALLAANSFLSPAKREKVEAFLQTDAPFTGAYVSQAGGVVGILKGMKETFQSNLESAQAAEQAAVEAHGAFIETKTAEWNTMDGAYTEKQTTLGTNDGDLGTKKLSLGESRTQKADDEAFLVTLEDMCSKKAKEYDQRTAMRVNEEAAISEAIAILNNDHSFEAFGKVTATSTGATSLVQLSSVRHRVRAATDGRRLAARQLLHEAALSERSSRLARIAGLLSLGNPFTVVLTEIDKVKALLVKEGEQDLEQKGWCETERTQSNTNRDAKISQITDLEGSITSLDDAINNPETGLKKLIADDETKLEENSKAQKDETELRRTENKQYQETIGNCVSASSILKKAVSVLQKYYDKMAKEMEEELGLVQKRREDPAPPSTWTQSEYAGQSSKGKDVIGMLEFILGETQQEETTAHDTEVAAQQAYEDSMQALKDEEKLTQESLATNKKELATKKEELEQTHLDKDKTEKEKIAIERYLERIKPGCDFITDNYATRETNRATETAALDQAVTLLKGTPAFAAAVAEENERKLGPCKSACTGNADHVDCKACLAKVSVPGYCAGHPTTPGC